MKILNISLDNKILNKDSAIRQRMLDYAGLVEKYTVIVPVISQGGNKEININEKFDIIAIASKNKIMALWNLYNFLDVFLKKEKYDVITVQDQYYIAFISLLLAKKYQVGLEIQNHGFEKFSGLRKMVFQYVIKRADAVRTVSQRLKKTLVEKFRVKDERITVVPIYVETNQAPGLKVQKIMVEDFIFLTIGRLVPVKNIEMQIDAMAVVAKNYPGAELWIVGDGPLINNLKLKIENLKLNDNVRLLGWHQNVKRFYEHADVFLLTSHAEAWPLVVIEAASYGLPMIITDTGSAGEFIINDENGIVIPVNNKKSLVEAMIKMIVNNIFREKLSTNVLESLKKLPGKEEILGLYRKSWQKAQRIE